MSEVVAYDIESVPLKQVPVMIPSEVKPSSATVWHCTIQVTGLDLSEQKQVLSAMMSGMTSHALKHLELRTEGSGPEFGANMPERFIELMGTELWWLGEVALIAELSRGSHALMVPNADGHFIEVVAWGPSSEDVVQSIRSAATHALDGEA